MTPANSLDLSAAQFRDGELLAAVMGALAASGPPARRLELEVSGSVLPHDRAEGAVLEGWRRLGVGTAILRADIGLGRPGPLGDVAAARRAGARPADLDRVRGRIAWGDPREPV